MFVPFFGLIRYLADPTHTVSSIIVCGSVQILLLVIFIPGVNVEVILLFFFFVRHVKY